MPVNNTATMAIRTPLEAVVKRQSADVEILSFGDGQPFIMFMDCYGSNAAEAMRIVRDALNARLAELEEKPPAD